MSGRGAARRRTSTPIRPPRRRTARGRACAPGGSLPPSSIIGLFRRRQVGLRKRTRINSRGATAGAPSQRSRCLIPLGQVPTNRHLQGSRGTRPHTCSPRTEGAHAGRRERTGVGARRPGVTAPQIWRSPGRSARPLHRHGVCTSLAGPTSRSRCGRVGTACSGPPLAPAPPDEAATTPIDATDAAAAVLGGTSVDERG